MPQLKNLLISTFAAAVMLLFGAVNEVNAGPLTYKIAGGKVSIVSCDKNASGELVIPSTYKEKPVTSIGIRAFSECSSLTSVRIPDSVTSIGQWAFEACYNLTSVRIPDSVTGIGGRAFLGCISLTSVRIPDGVTNIWQETFAGCSSLTSVTISDSVTSIGVSAFASCYRVYLTQKSIVTLFCSDSSLTIIEVGKGNTKYSSEDGVLYNKNKTELVLFPAGKSGHYTIPDSVTSIRTGAFRDCSSLTSVTIGNSVTSIGRSAFNSCSSLTIIEVGKGNAQYSSEDGVLFGKHKTELVLFPAGKSGHYTIPDSVTSIGDRAFNYCRDLMSVTIPDSVTSIGDYAFTDCIGLTSVTIPDSITSIGWYAFSGCKGLMSVTIGNSVTSIGRRAFEGCSSLTSVTIGNSVTRIGDWAFKDCSRLTSVMIPDSVTSIEWGAFAGCSRLKRVRIPDGVTRIEESTFNGCSSLTSVTIPDSVTSIGKFAFEGCRSLTSVTIPDSVTSIENKAFRTCRSLKSIIFEGNAPSSLGAQVFKYLSIGATITVSPGATGFRKTFGGLPVIIKIEINTFSKTDSPFTISFESKSGSIYEVQVTQDLKKWSKLGEVKGTSGEVKFTDPRLPKAPYKRNYFRVKLVE